jgi:hypothetical protein
MRGGDWSRRERHRSAEGGVEVIARFARIEEVRRLKRKGGGASHAARITADGLDYWSLLTSDAEIAWAERALDSGARLVLSISEESTS